MRELRRETLRIYRKARLEYIRARVGLLRSEEEHETAESIREALRPLLAPSGEGPRGTEAHHGRS